MSEHCPLAHNLERRCPVLMATRITELAGSPCEDNEKGNELCGPVAAYFMALQFSDELARIDSLEPIVGTLKINRISGAYSVGKEDMEKFWVGMEFPIRNIEAAFNGTLELSSIDAILVLLLNGRLYEADELLQADSVEPSDLIWKFQPGDVTLGIHQPASGFDYIVDKIAPEVRHSIETAARAGLN